MSESPLKSMKANVEVVTAPIRKQVIKALYDAISSGALRPGQRLVERDLCELLGVSRPPVREALRHLESDGLVVSLPKRGPIVAMLSAEDVLHIYQVRGALEGLAARLFTENATDEQIEELQAAAVALRQAVESNDINRVMHEKDRFYEILSKGCTNPLIATILASMKARIRMLRRMSLSSPARSPETLNEIDGIVAAIAARNPEAAFQRSWEHIGNATSNAVAMLARVLEDDADAADG